MTRLLLTNLRFLQTGLHSDLKVRDKNGHEWNVHKVVVAKFCNFFENALKGPCKESVTNVVEMTDDDPAALKALIEFLYVEDYDIMTATDNDIVLEFHLQVYIIATIYEVQSLRLMAFARFVRLLMTKTCPAPSLVSLLATAYANTRDSDKLLRPFVARLSIVHMAGLLGSQSNFLEVLVKYDDLRKDIARRMINMDLTTTCKDHFHSINFQVVYN
ncbi:hypothetical protein HDK77DRAFT_379835 [Phyllosticta capitalensis]